MEDFLSVAIVKPVNGMCNLDCKYECYMKSLLLPHINQKKMDYNTLKSVIDFFCSINPSCVEFIWHGGEPLLAGKNFFKNILIYQEKWKKLGRKIANFVQTNGTLINKNWLHFLKKGNFYVGVSLDLPEGVHNQLRPYRSYKRDGSKDTFKSVIQSIYLLKEANIFNGISCCVGRKNFHDAKNILNFLVENNIKNVKFLHIKKGIEAISFSEYFKFLTEVFDVWLELDDPDFEIRDLKTVLSLLFGGCYRECTNMMACQKFATVYSNGDIFACDSLNNLPQFKFGSVFDSSQTVLNCDNFNIFCKMSEEIPAKCIKCDFLEICKGGCFIERINPSSYEFLDYCDSKKRFLLYIQGKLENYGLL